MQVELLGLSARHPAAAQGSSALQGITLSVAAGEQVAVIGPSGAGKTTLLHVMACALAPHMPHTPPTAAPAHSAAFQLNGQDPWQLSKPALQGLRADLFLAPQVPPLPPRQRVVTSVLAGLLPRMGFWKSLRSLFYPSNIDAAHAALTQFDLADKLFERVDRLSGGERQRVGLARALVSESTLWLIDEPLSALDPSAAQQAMTTLTSNSRRRGITLVASLHQVEMALAHFPRIVGLKNGALVFDLPTADVTPERLQDLYA